VLEDAPVASPEAAEGSPGRLPEMLKGYLPAASPELSQRILPAARVTPPHGSLATQMIHQMMEIKWLGNALSDKKQQFLIEKQ